MNDQKKQKKPGALRAEILIFLQEHSRTGSPYYVSDEQLSAATGEPVRTIQEQLDILEAEGLTTTANAQQGRRARISPAGLIAAEQLASSLEEGQSRSIGFDSGEK